MQEYTVSYQRCCREPNVTNIIQPDDTGLTLSTHVPGISTGFTNNSSPRLPIIRQYYFVIMIT